MNTEAEWVEIPAEDLRAEYERQERERAPFLRDGALPVYPGGRVRGTGVYLLAASALLFDFAAGEMLDELAACSRITNADQLGSALEKHAIPIAAIAGAVAPGVLLGRWFPELTRWPDSPLALALALIVAARAAGLAPRE